MLPIYPFTAVVGQERMKRALVLNAVSPRIGGVLIRGERGTGKSTAARALAALLPHVNIVVECRFGCDPERSEELKQIVYREVEELKNSPPELQAFVTWNWPPGLSPNMFGALASRVIRPREANTTLTISSSRSSWIKTLYMMFEPTGM